ncbi:phage tail protein [Marinoscillum pacificum]|uniref:phage tail protein n=1 Tax=Marinoscillum pacificum TaxID=392723 RepID=UPI0021588A5C|nr:phage tail protein [Marinoscillum pacificum]
MKKITLTLFALTFICQFAFSQILTKGFSFQGYAIDGDDRAIASTNVTVKFTVYSSSQNYAEEHALTTDPYGIFSAIVGEGSKLSAESNLNFEELKFNYYDFKLKVEVKKTSGGTYATISDKTLNAVPYAQSASNGVPVGTIMAFAGPATKVPNGWLLCDGSTINSSTDIEYAPLFDAIGTAWGGTGAGSFNIPDLRGQFLRGLNETTSGTDANRTLGSSQGGAIQSHSHTASSGNAGIHDHGIGKTGNQRTGNGTIGVMRIDGSFTANSTDDDLSYGAANLEKMYEFPTATNTAHGQHSHTVTVNSTGSSETRPVNKAVNYIIKY